MNEGGTTNLSALAVTDAEMLPNYQWYFDNAPVSGATGTSLNLGTVPTSYNGKQAYVVASTKFGGLSITSSVATIYVSSAVFEAGFINNERWNNHGLADLESGNVAATPDYRMAVNAFAVSIDNPDMVGNFVRRVSGYFIPAVTTNYVFFTTGDDESDLFLSTDNTPANKRVVCQQSGWNGGGNWQWLTANGGAIASQTRSDQWTNSTSGGVAPYSGGIWLTQGQRYYIEQDFHQGGGGANNAVTFKFVNDPDPTVGTPTRLQGSLIGMTAVRCTYVAFTQEPTSTTTAPFSYVTFSADGTTDSTTPVGSIYGREEQQIGNYLFFQWYKNGVAIPGANSKTVTLGPLTGLDDGAVIHCSMRALGYADNSLNPIWSNSTPATITLSPKAVFEPGYVWVEWWPNIDSRAAIENGSAGLPTYGFTAPKFACPTDGDEVGTYSERITAFLVPPVTTNYVFWVNSDDDSDLFVGTNSSPIGKRLVAQEQVWGNPFNWDTAGGGGSSSMKRSDSWSPDGGSTMPYSTGIPLIAGQKYWLEQVHHNGYWGGHNAMATYAMLYDVYPANGDDTKLLGDVIGIYAPKIPWVAFLQQPTNETALSGGNPVTFTAHGTNPPSIWIGTSTDPKHWLGTTTNYACLQYQWYKNGTPIPGATGSSYTQPYVLPSDQGAEFVCGLRALGYSDEWLNRIYSNSTPAVLTVVTDTVPPTLTYAATFINSNQNPAQIIVNVTFSKWMDPATLSNATYTIGGVNVTNVSIASNHRTVQLLVDAVPSLPLTVTVTGAKDLSGNALAGSPTTAIHPVPLTFDDVGTPGSDPAYPSFVWVDASGGYIVEAQGSDIWGTSDGFNFGWELKTNDFDVVVRGVSNGHTSQYAKMGVMIREDLTAYSRNWGIFNTPVSSDGAMAPDNSGYGANRIEADMRDTVAGAASNWETAGYGPIPTYPNAWLRLKRLGSMLSGFYSTNGVDWLQMAAYDVSTNATPLTNVVYVGICNSAHNNDTVTYPPLTTFKYYNTAEFANYNSSYVPPAATLSVHLSAGNAVVSWSPIGGRLLASPAISGPAVNWQPVSATNPAVIPLGTGSEFFRVGNP